MSARPPVVLIGLDCPTGLQSARVFAARGVEVIGIAVDSRHPCSRTLSCRRVLEMDPGPDGLISTLLRLGPELNGRAVLVPCTDRAVLDVARHRAELSPYYLMAVPSAEVTELLLDKARFARFAEERGFPIPRTTVIERRADVDAVAAELDYPCILKPSFKSVAWSAHASGKVLWVESREELIRAYERHAPWADTFVVQEWIAGGDGEHFTCDCYLSADGLPLATFCSRKIRQWPPNIGQGCLSVEHENEIVRALTVCVLRAAGHHGQGYLEIKREAGSGRYLIVEANVGRPTGRAAAAEKAGVELLMTMYCDVIGAPLPTERVQTFRGTKWIHERRDLQACAHLLFTRRARLSEILESWRGRVAPALFSPWDPVPFLADWMHAAAQGLLRRMEPRHRSASERGLAAVSNGADRATAALLSNHQGCLPLPTPPPAGIVDFDVHGILGVRVRDARPDDLATVSRELGSAVTAGSRQPDIVVCFVDELPATGIERLEDDTAYRDGAVYHMSADGEPLAHVRLGEPLGGALIVCKRGLGHVPFLSEAIDLAALSHEWIPLHASGWVAHGTGVLAAGQAGSERTAALLAACQHGATPVAADHVLMALDGRAMVGLDRVMSLEEWQVAQLALPAPAVGPARRHLYTNVSLDRLGRASDACPDLLILLEEHDGEEIAAERLDPHSATERLSTCLQAGLMPALRGHLAFQAAFAGRGDRTGVRRVPRVATRLLREATRSKPCFLVRHPKECTLEQLHVVIEGLLPPAPASAPDATGTGDADGRYGPPAGVPTG